MHVFDKEIEEVWSNEITIPYSDELFSLQNYKVANTGDVFILGKLYQDKVRESRKGKPNFNYYILSYSYKENELDKIPVVIDGKFLTDMKIGINENNEVICGGFYSDEGTYSIKGSYFLRIDTESKKILSKSFKEFGIDFITQNMSDRQEKKAKKKKAKGKNVELFQYDLSDFVLREDGGVVLVGEQYYVRVSSYTDANGNTRTTYTYYYNDIIVININPKGQIEWAEKIPKRQVSSNDGGFYSSYALMVLEDKLYFVFNDNIKNLVITKNNQRVHNFSRGKNSVVTLVEMDSDGRYVREALFSGDETDIITRPKVCRQISDNEMIVFGQRKKKQRFAKVTFVD